MKAEYKILVGSRDEKSKNSILGRKQTAILTALVRGGGQLTTGGIAEAAQVIIDDDDVSVQSADVSSFLKAMKEQRNAQYKQLPTVKAGRRGKQQMTAASEGEFDSFLSTLLGEDGKGNKGRKAG